MARAPKSAGQRPDTAAGPHAVLSPDQIADLWERGYTVIPRTLFGRDPYAVADAVKRPGMAQQWGDKPKDAEYRASGWRMVTCEAWPGLFAPYGAVGNVEIDGLILMQKPQHEVDRVRDENHAKARQNVDDWHDRAAAAGFSGHVRTPEGRRDIGDQEVVRVLDGAPTVDTTVGIPRDMMPHVPAILAERDRICDECATGGGPQDIVDAYTEAMANNPQAPKWPTLRAIVMPTAIKNVRAKLKEGADHAANETTSDTDRSGRPADGSAGNASGAGGSDPAIDATGAGEQAARPASGGDGTAAGAPDDGKPAGIKPGDGA